MTPRGAVPPKGAERKTKRQGPPAPPLQAVRPPKSAACRSAAPAAHTELPPRRNPASPRGRRSAPPAADLAASPACSDTCPRDPWTTLDQSPQTIPEVSLD